MPSNLAPGVTTSMLPGNSASEQAADAFAADLDALLDDAMVVLSDGALEMIERWVWDRIQGAYRAGYAEGAADERMSRQNDDA